MRGGSPRDAPEGELERAGRAHRFSISGERELWRSTSDDKKLGERLLALGESRIGGFTGGGIDDEGIWLVRAPKQPTLSNWMKKHRALPWPEAVAVVASLARACADCESEGLFPGPLAPSTVSMLGDEPHVRADHLVFSMFGADVAEVGSGASVSTRWMPPEQAEGAPWDNAANRYVLGLIFYRLLAGEHPFAGQGLRRALDDQAHRGAPPLPVELRRELPPGLQGYCLRLIDPDARARPSSALEIARRLEGLASGESGHDTEHERVDRKKTRATREAPPSERPPSRTMPKASPAPAQPSSPGAQRWLARLPWIAAAVGGLAALLALKQQNPAVAESVGQERAPLSTPSMSVGECTGCHARQASEWTRSVMAHSAKSPLFQALEILIQEQVGRSADCPGGAGVLRVADRDTACVDRESGLPITGSGGEHWCVNCHSPGENLARVMPAWDGRSGFSRSRRPLVDLLPPETMEGISCGFCHQVHGPVRPGNSAAGRYEGNPFWTSTSNGQRFTMRPEDARGVPGIANSGYFLDPAELMPGRDNVPGDVHSRPSADAKAYLRSSKFCGACHDVRLFGTDVIGIGKGEHFKRLRNAYSEWEAWAIDERRAGREPASCQDCHMSTFPGVCVRGEKSVADDRGDATERACPPGTRFEPRAPGIFPDAPVSSSSGAPNAVVTHYFSGVDVPLTPSFDEGLVDEPTLDSHGIPLGARQRRDVLLARTFGFEVDEPRLVRTRLEIPIVITNTGAGHRVPAGFSQEREFWVHLKVTDGRGDVVYEVGKVTRGDEDLHDKVFLRVNTSDDLRDGLGRPLGLFGADVADGVDAPRWSPPPELGGFQFRGRGLINFQNGFLRCVVCIGSVGPRGECEPLPGQEGRRADRFADGDYDIDTGECRSNLFGRNALFETYFPIGALDSSRGVAKGPDAIIDTRSLPPGKPVRYTYELDTRGRTGPYVVEARLMFRAFPPFLLKAFIDYELRQAARGLRPSGPLIDQSALERLEIVEIMRRKKDLG